MGYSPACQAAGPGSAMRLRVRLHTGPLSARSPLVDEKQMATAPELPAPPPHTSPAGPASSHRRGNLLLISWQRKATEDGGRPQCPRRWGSQCTNHSNLPHSERESSPTPQDARSPGLKIQSLLKLPPVDASQPRNLRPGTRGSRLLGPAGEESSNRGFLSLHCEEERAEGQGGASEQRGITANTETRG